MGVERWRKQAEDRSVWATILKEALVKLRGSYAKEEDLPNITPQAIRNVQHSLDIVP
jgi:hypothetical protein